MSKLQHFSVVIVAGGKGLRAGGEIPKQFQPIGEKPMLMRTIEAFYNFDDQMRIVIVLPEEFRHLWNELCEKHNFRLSHTIVSGGETRFHSVKNGLSEISEDEIVGIHDAARPFVSKEVIGRCYREAFDFRCGIIPVIEERNSVRILTAYENKAFDRERIRVVQTPQVFPAGLLKNAYETPYREEFTDDASVAEDDGIQIKLVEGDEKNIKITTPLDLRFAEFLYRDNLI
ncbi:MAG TPA: 2-C-methyl-D-erythritol 4-phosphate cytidylyltransferase [Petrimonas sp.]|uniref:2-C-methyl-D-erythritol 4-phosphate cytidylyltransferase n=2 Tax=Petrimonas sp. TaxID=2023866 RepID=UPI00095C249D|nr:MAG: 2-C-methyl-D-erythritol 4-phosphate cytidylyltransferase [Bacteroidia bacterium 43-41]HHV87254.1 2-C-methyl-D-erythritol 4-phosphate cytidylyltransferase [Petrimonas sp.]